MAKRRVKKKMSDAKNSDPGNVNNLAQVRELLFGEYVKQVDARLGQLNEKVRDETKRLKDDLRQSGQGLQQTFKTELSALNDHLKQADSERAATDKSVQRQLKELTTTVEKRFHLLDQQIEQTEASLRDAITTQVSEATAALREQLEELSEQVDVELDDLRTTKADNQILSDLFHELALRLKGELKKPAPVQKPRSAR